MQAVIMAAGRSTRTYPLTLTRPKPLLPVMNKPILAHQLDALQGLVDGVVLVVNYRREQIEERFGDEYNGLPLKYVVQNDPLGTGHAVLQCADLVSEPFLAMNGDDLYAPGDLRRLAEEEQAALAKEVPDPRLYGIYELTDGNRAVRLVEKPVDVFSNLANVGAYKFTPDVFDVLAETEASERGEIEITSAIQTLAETGDFRVVTMDGYWLPVGYPWHLLDVNEHFLRTEGQLDIKGEVDPHAHINGRVAIGAGTVVRSGVVIDGPVCIGENASLGPNCWIRPGTTIGNGCRVGQASEIKNSILMDGAAVPHLSYAGDTVIGEGSNFGAGTITANVRHDGKNVQSMVKDQLVDSGRRKLGAIVADNVHTGIHTSIYPGRKLWPNTSTYPGETVTKDITEVRRRPPR
jgi:UDP-N-acetylglucosamine diphosphorylase / glucose-1-phosphate thymidylyltransferase / UDP-N-acetylgalactosamine diphosphorylase / glucosamine-1-phosphate N-acetyltransferase / galactosamine-1-phosphate N-acetyltransferase